MISQDRQGNHRFRHPTTTATPWGRAQHAYLYQRGLNFYSTAGHGGFRVSPGLLKTMHPALQNPDGWYEEDCEASKVIVAFPDLFTLDTVAGAMRSLQCYEPEIYAAVFPNAAESVTEKVECAKEQIDSQV